MTTRTPDGSNLTRRSLLRLGAGALGAAAFAPVVHAAPNDLPIDSLMRANTRTEFNAGFDSASRTIRMPASKLPTLSSATVQATEQAIQQYAAMATQGSFRPVPVVERLRLGTRSSAVIPLRQRLIAGGDLAANAGTSDIFDSYVEAAVRRFQARHGLSVDGVVRELTFRALNIPPDVRLRQLETNLVRLRSMSRDLGPRFVTVNIPAAQIETVENGQVVMRHTAVVGKPDRQSPVMQARITEINFNPFWTVPSSIIRKDLIPKMQAEPDYLTKNHIRIYDQRGQEVQPQQINWNSDEAMNFRFRQDTGDFNSMGSVRVNIPNPHGVYMHDTPQKTLFGEDFRFHSSGCVRVQNVREYVVWLLSGTPGWGRAEIDRAIRSGERIDARIAQPVPAYWVYISAWATPDGVVQFRDDIYGLDGIGTGAVAAGPASYGQPPQPAAGDGAPSSSFLDLFGRR